LWSKLLAETEIGMAGQSTVFGDAIGLAIKLFKESTSDNRVLPLWALPSTPFQPIFIKDRASVCSSTDLRCVTTPSHTIWAEYSVATSAVISLYFTKNNLFRQGM
jgi:hypothetical protein